MPGGERGGARAAVGRGCPCSIEFVGLIKACWQGFGNGDGGGSSVPSEFSVSPASREVARDCSMPSNAAGGNEEWCC